MMSTAKTRWILNTTLAVALLACCAATTHAQVLLDDVPDQAQGVEVTEKLGARIPPTISIVTAEGERITIGEYFNDTAADGDPKPTILAMVYYSCPIVCDVTLTRLAKCVQELDYTVGEDFNLVVVSFDYTEPISKALERKEQALAGYSRPITPIVRRGMGYHVTNELGARELSQATGFGFRRLANGEYSHPVALMALTPEGTISRYIYGFDYPPKRMKLALLEASQGKVAKSWGDRLLFTCYRYDPNSGTYTLQAMRVMRIGGLLSLFSLASLIGILKLKEVRRKKRLALANQSNDSPSMTPATTG